MMIPKDIILGDKKMIRDEIIAPLPLSSLFIAKKKTNPRLSLEFFMHEVEEERIR